MSDEIIPAHELYRIAKRFRQSALQFALPYEFEGIEMVVIPKAQWEKLNEAVESYAAYWFNEKIGGR